MPERSPECAALRPENPGVLYGQAGYCNHETITPFVTNADQAVIGLRPGCTRAGEAATIAGMETPLSPLDFARRTRRLHADREAVVDGELRLTYRQFFDRCDRWSAALQGLGVGQSDRVATIAPNTHAQLESFYAVPQIGAVLVPINYRLTAEDFVYIVNHSGAKVVCVHGDYLAADRRRPGPDARGRALRGVRGRCWQARAGCDYEAAIAAADPGFQPAGDRRARPALDQLHQRHHGAPEGRDDHAPERRDQHDRHPAAPADARRASGTCGRCRCSTPTAGPSPGR